MNNSKVIRHLSQLDKNEWKDFGFFLDSPYFFKGGKDEKLIRFYQHLNRYYPTFQHKKLTEELAFAAVYLNRPFNKNAFQQLTTKFNKAIERFIEMTYRPKTFGFPPDGMGMVAFYEEKKMFRQFEKSYASLSKKLSKKQIKNQSDLWFDFLQAEQLTAHQGNFGLRHTDLNLPKTLISLDHFYLVIKLQYACAFQNQNNYQHPIEAHGGLAALNAILPLLKAGKFREEPLVDLLYRTYLILQNEASEQEFMDLKIIFEKQAKSIDLYHRQIIHVALRNFCSREINEGKEEYLSELMKLYEEGLPLNVLYSEGKIVAATFQNMVTAGIRLKKYDWVEKFLEEHQHRILSKEEPESYYTLAKATLLFNQNQFEEALEYLTYNFTDTYSKLIARRIEVQIFYELKSNVLDSKIQAFKVFVFRNSKSSLTAVQKEGYSNFIDTLKQIIHPATLYNTKRIKAICDKLVTKQTVAGKEWLMSKLEALRQHNQEG